MTMAQPAADSLARMGRLVSVAGLGCGLALVLGAIMHTGQTPPTLSVAYVQRVSAHLYGTQQGARLGLGCTVDVLATAGELARVRLDGCDDEMAAMPSPGTFGWIASAALGPDPPFR